MYYSSLYPQNKKYFLQLASFRSLLPINRKFKDIDKSLFYLATFDRINKAHYLTKFYFLGGLENTVSLVDLFFRKNTFIKKTQTKQISKKFKFSFIRDIYFKKSFFFYLQKSFFSFFFKRLTNYHPRKKLFLFYLLTYNLDSIFNFLKTHKKKPKNFFRFSKKLKLYRKTAGFLKFFPFIKKNLNAAFAKFKKGWKRHDHLITFIENRDLLYSSYVFRKINPPVRFLHKFTDIFRLKGDLKIYASFSNFL